MDSNHVEKSGRASAANSLPAKYRGRRRYDGGALLRLLLLLPTILVGLAAQPGLASGAVVRVDLGIFGGRATDLDAFTDYHGDTRVIAAVEGDGAGVLLNGAVTRWTPIFFGRPGEIQEVEADRTTGGSATDIVYALLYDGRVFTNPSAAYSPSWSPSAWAPSTGGTTLVGEYGTTLLGHSTGTYLGTASGALYRTIDGGTNWTLLATPSAGNRIVSIAAHVDHTTDPSLWVVVDVAGTPELLPLTYSSSSLSYTTGAAITVGGSGGVFERVFVYPDTTIANAPLLFVTGDSPSESVYRGTSGGSAWSTITSPRHYFQHMAFDLAHARIYAASAVSNDLGLTFTTLPTYARLRGDIHPNDGTMVVDPNNTDRVLYASDWFVGEYTITAGTWAANGELAANLGVMAVLVQDMHQIMDTSSTKETFIFGGKAGIGISNDFVSHSGAFPSWRFPIYPQDDGAPISATRLQDYDGDGATMENVFAGNNSGRVYRSTTQGRFALSYTRVFDPLVDAVGYYEDPDRIEVRDIVEDPSSLDDMYFGFGDWDTGRVGGGVACSTDNGATWSIDPSWVALADPMKVNALQVTNTKLWIGVGKDDDSDPNHRGLYYKGGSLAGCGTGTFYAVSTGTAIDSAIVYDLGGPTTSPIYVASSAGLFRGELSSGVWTWTDISGSLGLPTASPWRAVTYNPSPTSPCAEEFYGATGDQIFRIRECGSGYVSTLISPAPFEDVHALLWDELVVGTAGGLWSLGHASKDVTSCRASFDKARDKYMTDATKIGLGCRVRELEGGGTCPDSVATASIAKAESRIDLSKKCSDGLVAGLSDSWDGLCRGVANVEDLETCLVSQVDDSAEEALAGYFGASGTTTATSDGSCEESLGKAYGRVLKIGLKAISKCERKIDKDKETNCPNAEVEALIAKQGTKALRKISRSCTDANAVALEARGLPDGCVGVNTVASMHACLMDASGELISALVSPAETEF